MKRFLPALALLASGPAAWAGFPTTQTGSVDLFPDHRSIYSWDIGTGEAGNTWFAIYYPDGVMSIGGQELDAAGNFMLDSGDEPMEISAYSNYTYTVVNDEVMVDSDSNALIAVQDCRESPDYRSYTIYKISPEGEMLWGDEGVTLGDGEPYGTSAALRMIELADGSYVFAYMMNSKETGNMAIYLQRLANDGSVLWAPGEVELDSSSTSYWYPWLVDAGYNQFILVFAEGSNQNIYARKIDFDGSDVWSDDVCLCKSGFGYIPIWTLIRVEPSGDGGVVIAWNDDRYYTNYEKAYINYVTSNGKYGFPTGADGLALADIDYIRQLGVHVKYDPASDTFIATWLETNPNQTYYALKAQKVGKSGETYWGEGIELFPMDVQQIAYTSLQVGNDGKVASFFEVDRDGSYGVENFVYIIDTATGEALHGSPFDFAADANRTRSKLQTSNSGSFWVAAWNQMKRETDENGDEHEVTSVRCLRINYDGTFGDLERGGSSH